MVSHQVCKHCKQRKHQSEYTVSCPARPAYGHEWETFAGNGITWSESLVGKLWKTKFGKIVLLIIAFILLLMMI